MAKGGAVFEMAVAICQIWQTGDGCPLAVSSIIKKYNKDLEPQCLKYLKQHRTKAATQNVSEYVKKYHLPSTSREPSK